MKNIKFRVWDKKAKWMLSWEDILEGKTGNAWQFFMQAIKNKNDRFPIMQFTGLTDMNGKQIYEGDILKHYKMGDFDKKEPIIGEVIFDSNGVSAGYWPVGHLDKCEVIGNIYEGLHKK